MIFSRLVDGTAKQLWSGPRKRSRTILGRHILACCAESCVDPAGESSGEHDGDMDTSLVHDHVRLARVRVSRALCVHRINIPPPVPPHRNETSTGTGTQRSSKSSAHPRQALSSVARDPRRWGGGTWAAHCPCPGRRPTTATRNKSSLPPSTPCRISKREGDKGTSGSRLVAVAAWVVGGCTSKTSGSSSSSSRMDRRHRAPLSKPRRPLGLRLAEVSRCRRPAGTRNGPLRVDLRRRRHSLQQRQP